MCCVKIRMFFCNVLCLKATKLCLMRRLPFVVEESKTVWTQTVQTPVYTLLCTCTSEKSSSNYGTKCLTTDKERERYDTVLTTEREIERERELWHCFDYREIYRESYDTGLTTERENERVTESLRERDLWYFLTTERDRERERVIERKREKSPLIFVIVMLEVTQSRQELARICLNPSHTKQSSHYVNVKPVGRSKN